MWVSEWLLLRKCSETAQCRDIIRSRVVYRSSMFIESVFEATFSFPNVL